MRGVYIIDLEEYMAFICVANDLTHAKEITTLHKTLYHIEGNMEGSFHYFPVLLHEADVEAEIRIYKNMTRLLANTTFYCPKTTMEVLAQSTWKPRHASSVPLVTKTAIQNTPSSDQIFKMSMD
jgi:uncharacterized membrane protein